MNKVDKNLLLKELDIYSSVLKKYEAVQREKIRKATITQQAKINQKSSLQKSFQDFSLARNQYHLSSFNNKFSSKNLSHFSSSNVKNERKFSTYGQNFISKYSLSKNQVPKVSNSITNIKKVNPNISVANVKSASNSKSDSLKKVSVSSPFNEFKKQTYNAKDFINEVESLTKLLKKETSSISHKISNSNLSIKSVKDHNKNVFEHSNTLMKVNSFSKSKIVIESHRKSPFLASHVNKINYSKSSVIKSDSSQQKTSRLNQSMYKKNNVKQSLAVNSVMASKNLSSASASKNGFENIGSKLIPETVFSDNTHLSLKVLATSKTGELHKKPSSPCFQERIIKLHTPRSVLSSKKPLKKSPHVKQIKSPIFLKLKSSNADKVPRIINPNQNNTKYTKINKCLNPPKKVVHTNPDYSMQHKSSLKKVKRKINKYKIINKTLTPSSSKKMNTTVTSVNTENTALNMDCDTFDDLDDSAIEKIEKNLLALTSELASPDVSDKKENFSNCFNMPVSSQISSESVNKRIHVKKFKSRISKYKVIHYNASKKAFARKVQSPRISLKKEKAVLVRRLFKSKSAIINKNASPTSYSAKLIKSKYHLLNKRKSSNCQKYAYPARYQYPVFKGFYSGTTFHHQQKRFKNNAASRASRRSNYRCQPFVLTNKNSYRCFRTKINNRLAIRKFHRTTNKVVVKMPENTIKAFPASTDYASRVLHRSINRILTASSKKKLLINRYCMFYNRFGRCNRGVKCSYIHDPSKIAVCTRFLRGTCKIDRCPFSHEVNPGKMAICSFFLVGHCDKENCPYRHERLSPHAVLCKDFVQGYCYHGKECKKAHILVCPKYVQGNCEKGSLCTFPHPPQKPKKNIQEEVKNDDSKPTDALLDNVLRYFQQIGHSQNKLDENNASNLVVPKQGKLEQQPSFIPLS